MLTGKKYYFLSFDLNIDNLKMYYPNKNINQAWDDIKRFMTKNGFEHNQYSAYISKDRITQYKIRSIMKSMYQKLPWFPLCANKVMLSELNSQEKLLTSIIKIKAIKIMIDKLKANPPGQNREDILLPKKEPGTRELLPERSELTLTPEQFRALSEAGVGLKVTVDSKDLKKASKILEAANCPAQAGVHKPKR